MHGTNVTADKPLTKRQRASLLRKTAKFFEENPESWIRGTIRSAGGTKFCAIGALSIVAAGLPSSDNTDHYDVAARVMTAETINAVVPGATIQPSETGGAFWRINDSRRKTPDVQTLCRYLRQMARYLEHGGN